MNGKSFRRLLSVLLLSSLGLSLTACDGIEDRKEVYFAKGKEFFDSGDYVRARLELKNTLQLDNRHAESWYLLGRIEEQGKEFKKAFANYSRAIEFDPNLVGPRVYKAQLLITAKELDMAQEDIDAALALAPQDPRALVARGILRQHRGDAVGAEADARAVLALEPESVAAAALLAKVQAEQNEIDAAEQTLQRAIEANPDDTGLKIALGGLYDSKGDVEGALQVLMALVERDQQNVDYRVRLAGYHEELGQLDQAEAVLRDGLKAAPEELDLQRQLVQFLTRAHGAERGMEELASMIDRQPNSAELRFMRADLLRSAGDLAALEGTLRHIIEAAGGIGPDAIRAQSALARLLVEQGQKDQAIPLIDKVLQQSATEPEALELRAVLSLERDQVESAIADLRTVLRDHPTRITALRTLGLAHAQRAEFALAQDALKRAIELSPEDPAAYLQLAKVRAEAGDAEGAVAALKRLLAADPDNVAAQTALSRIQVAREDWEAVSEMAVRMKKTRPEYYLGHYLEGLVLQRDGDHPGAMVRFDKALKLNPEAADLLLALAQSHLALDEPAKAKPHVDKVLVSDPTNLAALHLTGDVLLAMGDAQQAVSAMDEAVRHHPKSARAYLRLAQLQDANNDNKSARETLLKGLQMTGRNGLLVLQLAQLQEQAGNHEAAAEHYAEVVRRFPDALAAVNNLVALLLRDAEDQAALDRALQLASRLKESDVPEFIDTLGWAHYVRKEYDIALPYLEQAVDGRPENPELRFHLGMVYAKVGRTEDARGHLSMAAAATGFAKQTDAQKALDELTGG